MGSKIPILLDFFTFLLIINTTATASAGLSRLFSQEVFSSQNDNPVVFLFNSVESTTPRSQYFSSKNKNSLKSPSGNNQELVMALLQDLLKLQKQTGSSLRSRSTDRKYQRSRQDRSDQNRYYKIVSEENLNNVRSYKDRSDRGRSARERFERIIPNKGRSSSYGSPNNNYANIRSGLRYDNNYYRQRSRNNLRQQIKSPNYEQSYNKNDQYSSRSTINKIVDHSPVVKSLLILRNRMSCSARNECEDECDSKFSGKKKNKCEDSCDSKFDCEEEQKDDCDDGECDSGNDCEQDDCTGSTKGEIYVTEEPGCPRC